MCYWFRSSFSIYLYFLVPASRFILMTNDVTSTENCMTDLHLGSFEEVPCGYICVNLYRSGHLQAVLCYQAVFASASISCAARSDTRPPGAQRREYRASDREAVTSLAHALNITSKPHECMFGSAVSHDQGEGLSSQHIRIPIRTKKKTVLHRKEEKQLSSSSCFQPWTLYNWRSDRQKNSSVTKLKERNICQEGAPQASGNVIHLMHDALYITHDLIYMIPLLLQPGSLCPRFYVSVIPFYPCLFTGMSSLHLVVHVIF